MLEKLYTATEAAEALRLAKITLYKLVKAGKLGHCAMGANGRGTALRFRESDLQAYIDASHVSNAKK